MEKDKSQLYKVKNTKIPPAAIKFFWLFYNKNGRIPRYAFVNRET